MPSRQPPRASAPGCCLVPSPNLAMHRDDRAGLGLGTNTKLFTKNSLCKTQNLQLHKSVHLTLQLTFQATVPQTLRCFPQVLQANVCGCQAVKGLHGQVHRRDQDQGCVALLRDQTSQNHRKSPYPASVLKANILLYIWQCFRNPN